jgi:hypothetical protein
MYTLLQGINNIATRLYVLNSENYREIRIIVWPGAIILSSGNNLNTIVRMADSLPQRNLGNTET